MTRSPVLCLMLRYLSPEHVTKGDVEITCYLDYNFLIHPHRQANVLRVSLGTTLRVHTFRGIRPFFTMCNLARTVPWDYQITVARFLESLANAVKCGCEAHMMPSTKPKPQTSKGSNVEGVMSALFDSSPSSTSTDSVTTPRPRERCGIMHFLRFIGSGTASGHQH